MKAPLAIAIAALGGMNAVQGALLVYEGFDYPINLGDAVAGAQNGKNEGIGFVGPWEDMTSGSNPGEGFIYDSTGNTNGTNGSKPNWDGVVDNLPQAGGYVGLSPFVDDVQQDRMNARRPLAQSAGAMAGADRVLWMSMAVHFEDARFFFAPGLALTDGGGFEERVVNLSDVSNGLGIGNGGPPINDGRNATDVTASAYLGGTRDEASKTNIANLNTTVADYVIVLRYTFGDESDSLSVWAFAETDTLSQDTFNTSALTLVTSIDENTLTTLATGFTRAGNAYDEIRIGDTFGDVVSGVPSPDAPFEITAVAYDPDGDPNPTVTLTWTSRPGTTYTAKISTDLTDWSADIGDGLSADIDENPNDGAHITATLSLAGLENLDDLFFRIEEE